MKLDSDYWSNRYQSGNTPWDIGDISPPLRMFFDQLPDKSIRILIPGAGRAHEAIYLLRNGFSNVYVCDWAPEALLGLKPLFPPDRLICDNFFNLESEFDLLVEQTFFCALPPVKRKDYVKKAAQLLTGKGCLVGLLFASEFTFDGPPFGGTSDEYRLLFQPYFEIESMDVSTYSIRPRLGNELFVRMRKKNL